jgi:hypothetical protein
MRTCVGATSGIEVDFFPLLVLPRASKSATSNVSIASTLMPMPLLQRRSKRLREGLDIVQNGLLQKFLQPLSDLSPVTPASCAENTSRTARESGNCLRDNAKALDTMVAPSFRGVPLSRIVRL